MKLSLKHTLAAVGLMLSFAVPAAAGPFEDGVAAYSKGDYATALRLLFPLAEQGNARAQLNLGVMYNNGWGVTQNDAEAAKWFRKAAEQGLANAQYLVGNMYVLQDYLEAVKWYRLAADQGLDIAQYALGLMYDIGENVPQDYAEAVKWYRLAADQGHVSAQYNLGLMYGRGRGGPQNYVHAHMWSNVAAARGMKNAAKYRDEIAQHMTPTQIAEAQKLAREWKPTK